jgi:DNA-binding GntR family transcriptional regulator
MSVMEITAMTFLSEDIDINGMDGPLGQRVYTILRKRILDLSLPPGAVLRKGALCEQLGVSRSPVADALSRLSGDGLVDIIPQSATHVSRFSMSALKEESFLRDAVEVAAVATVAENRTDAQLVQLSRNLRLQSLLVEDVDFEGFFEADLQFHDMILSFTGFRKVAAVAGQMSLQLQRARILALPEPGRPARTVAEHQKILAAIEALDAEAAKTAMADHLRQLISRIAPLEKQYPDYFRPN